MSLRWSLPLANPILHHKVHPYTVYVLCWPVAANGFGSLNGTSCAGRHAPWRQHVHSSSQRVGTTNVRGERAAGAHGSVPHCGVRMALCTRASPSLDQTPRTRHGAECLAACQWREQQAPLRTAGMHARTRITWHFRSKVRRFRFPSQQKQKGRFPCLKKR